MSLPLRQAHPRAVLARLRALVSGVPHMGPERSVVLVYHGVTARTPLRLNTRFVSRRRLAADLRALQAVPGLRFVTLAEALAPAGSTAGPRVALTFDDGYRGMLTQALPVLEALRVPATLFVTTLDAHPPAAEARRMLWADRLDVAAWLGHAPLVIEDERFALDRRRTWRRSDGASLKALCQARDVGFLDQVAQACDPGDGLPEYWRLLDPEDLRTLAAHPLVTLGAHGVTHANLPGLSVQEKAREITGSKAWLEDCVQTEISAFAYPHGDYTSACVSAVRRAGFRIQALLDARAAADAAQPDLCTRIGNHPTCGSLVQRQVIAAGGYGHEVAA